MSNTINSNACSMLFYIAKSHTKLLIMVGKSVKLYYFVIIVIILFELSFQFQHGMARPLKQNNDEDDQHNINTNIVVIISSSSAHNKKVLEEINIPSLIFHSIHHFNQEKTCSLYFI